MPPFFSSLRLHAQQTTAGGPHLVAFHPVEEVSAVPEVLRLRFFGVWAKNDSDKKYNRDGAVGKMYLANEVFVCIFYVQLTLQFDRGAS
jgi:hypothetical protein